MKPRYSASLPEPMRVNEATIERCRREVEGKAKAMLRKMAVALIRLKPCVLEVGEGFQWGRPLTLPREGIRVGSYAYIGAHGAMMGPTVIGDLCMISSHVRFVGNDHRTDVVGGPVRLEFSRERPLTVLEAECWIGQGATIREGITIGRGAVVGAGAVVTKSVAPYAIVGGCPAKELRRRFTDSDVARHDATLYSTSLD